LQFRKSESRIAGRSVNCKEGSALNTAELCLDNGVRLIGLRTVLENAASLALQPISVRDNRVGYPFSLVREELSQPVNRDHDISVNQTVVSG
jgi:hypothetical protein